MGQKIQKILFLTLTQKKKKKSIFFPAGLGEIIIWHFVTLELNFSSNSSVKIKQKLCE